MAKRLDSTPKKDGYRMPGEFEPQDRIYMIWPERPDNWRNGGKPAQKTYVNIATAISEFTPVTMIVSPQQYANARARLPENIRVVEMVNDDAWVRDCGPSFLVDRKGGLRAVDWTFNAWGGLYDGLYFPWANDDAIAQKICELNDVDSYRTDFVLEGGSITVDGEGTLITTEMCLLSPGRNPNLTKEQIEEHVSEYLNLDKVIWLRDGMDPDETNGHVDDVACFARPGEVICIYTDDPENPYYEVAQDAYRILSEATDAKGRKLKVHKLCLLKEPVPFVGGDEIDAIEGTLPRIEGEPCVPSYMNFLITNGGIICPQFGDENDALAISQLQEIFPDKKVVGVRTEEVIYGGGNIHCITQQQPKP
ncbi:MAG: agmatine deiminase [Lachnospiraceae bacterium]|jgi:agmatine deiminase